MELLLVIVICLFIVDIFIRKTNEESNAPGCSTMLIQGISGVTAFGVGANLLDAPTPRNFLMVAIAVACFVASLFMEQALPAIRERVSLFILYISNRFNHRLQQFNFIFYAIGIRINLFFLNRQLRRIQVKFTQSSGLLKTVALPPKKYDQQIQSLIKASNALMIKYQQVEANIGKHTSKNKISPKLQHKLGSNIKQLFELLDATTHLKANYRHRQKDSEAWKNFNPESEDDFWVMYELFISQAKKSASAAKRQAST